MTNPTHTSGPASTIRRRLLGTGVAATAVSMLPRGAAAQKGWPSRPITFIAAQAPGSSNDGTARAYADYMATHLGVPIVIENKPGGAGMIAATQVARSAPDGYTFLLTLHSQLAQAPVLLKKAPIDPDTDLVPIASLSTGRGVMVCHKDLPARNFEELVELSRKRPVTVGNYSIGSGWQLMMAEVAKRTGGQFTILNYRGTGSMVGDLVGGQIDIGAGSLAGLGPLIERGNVRPLVVITGAGMTDRLPGVQSWAETGMPAELFNQLEECNMLLAPAGVPDAVVKRMGELWQQGAKESARVQALRYTLVADEEPLTGQAVRDYVKHTWPVYRKLSTELGLAGTI